MLHNTPAMPMESITGPSAGFLCKRTSQNSTEINSFSTRYTIYYSLNFPPFSNSLPAKTSPCTGLRRSRAEEFETNFYSLAFETILEGRRGHIVKYKN